LYFKFACVELFRVVSQLGRVEAERRFFLFVLSYGDISGRLGGLDLFCLSCPSRVQQTQSGCSGVANYMPREITTPPSVRPVAPLLRLNWRCINGPNWARSCSTRHVPVFSLVSTSRLVCQFSLRWYKDSSIHPAMAWHWPELVGQRGIGKRRTTSCCSEWGTTRRRGDSASQPASI
jgi:hypothetical protein